ncbi:dehydrase and lipid transport-domain-containing protein [Mycena rosella]|uniref:Dehydrase and lipid transport-domain-containing protein n=1 Tax=Mycena rosella TaxID=1033263 RepID=A0AAD7DWP4_MYCRO|nr:dehydrase and lipid transport-domain-containing protein [Mycena rosella]
MLRLSRLSVPRTVPTHRRRLLFSLPDFSSILPGGGSEVQTYHEQKTLPYTRQQLYNVVSDVRSYHHFIPFCSASRVLSATDETRIPILLDAELTVQFLAFKESYVSRVTCIPLESVQAVASSSTPLFKELTTTWRFQAIPSREPPSAPPSSFDGGLSERATDSAATLASLDLAFAFASPIHAAVSSSFFGQVSKLMVNAFEERCAEVYGGGARKG